jgi:hypothetical protein
VKALAAIRPDPEEVVPTLQQTLRRAQPPEAVLLHALLGKLSGTEVQEGRRIVKLLRAHPRETFSVAELAFRVLGAAALPVLLEILSLEEGNGELCPVALRSLDDLDPQSLTGAPGKLGPLLKDERFRYDALRIAAKIGPDAKELVPALAACLRERTAVQQALFALACIGPEARPAVPAIEPLLGEEKFQYHALQALENIGSDARGAAPKIASLKAPMGQKIAALAAVGADADLLRPFVVEAMERRSSYRSYVAACRALPRLGAQAQSVIPVLADQLGGLWDEPAVDALAALGPAAAPAAEGVAAVLWDQLRYQRSEPPVLALLCCKALGRMGPAVATSPPVMEALQRAQEHRISAIQEAARDALARIEPSPEERQR